MATDALYFNNETSGGNYFDLTGPALPNGDWAIGFWCRPDLMTNASASYQYVISAGSLGTVGSMQIFIPSRQNGIEGCSYLRFYSDAGSAELNTVGCTATVLPGVGDGSDYLFIVQRRGSDLDYYVVKEGSATATPTTVASAAWGGGLNSRAWRIGGRTDAASLRWLSNPMGELFVIGQSLTAAQIVNLASGKHIDAVVATRLLDLRFRGNNAIESDLSGNGRNATRTGSNFSLVNEFFPDTVAASVTTPTISAPANGATGVATSPSFTASAFAGSAGLTHASSDWQVASDSGFATIVKSVSADTTSKTTWSTTGLTAGTTYYARVRYRANDGTVSSYSATVSFTTATGTVSTPSVTTPANGATGVSANPSFTASAFAGSAGLTHASSDWRLATDSGFTNVVKSANADTTNKTTWSTTGLTAGTTYYLRVRYLANDGSVSSYSATVSFTTAAAASVTTPTISAPANGATGVSASPSFTASAFAGSGGLTHASSDWQVASDSGFANIVKSASADTTNKTTWSTTGLTAGTTYYARVRYRANDGTVSSYSATVSFTVLGTVTAPTISAPANGATGVSASPSFTASAFAGSAGLTHASSDWQVASDSGFANIVKSASADTTNKTTWSTTGLTAGTTYYARVRYRANDGTVSSYSATVSFTTAAPAATLNTPTISSPANGSVGFKGALTLSGFSVSNGSDQHASTTWQASTSNTFSTLAASTTNDAVNKLSWTPSGLATGTTYYARALVTGANLGSSSWSPTISFTTIRTNTPTVSAPAGNSTSPTITSSAFSSTGVDQHVSTSWQAATDASFTTGLIDNANDVANLTSWVPSLAASTTYYLRCRHVGQAGGVSAWSATVTYTTGAVVTEALPSAIATTGTRALFPYAITDTVLKDASIQETDYAAWDPGTNYALGVKCIRVATHSVYQRITPGVSATPPESDPVNWVKVGPTNRWGMFDGAVGTVSSATTSFTVILTLGPVNDAAFLNVTGSSIQIQLPSGTTVTKSVPSSPVAGVGSTVLFQSLGGTAGDYRITVTGTGTVSVGNLSLGNFVSVGSPKYGVNLGYTDYSVREIDAFGSLKLVPRPAQDRMDVQLEIPKASANQVAYVLAALRAKPCVWLGVPDYDTTVIFGTIKSQSVRFSNKSYVDGQIQINALTLG